jgi:hypothetical protein
MYCLERRANIGNRSVLLIMEQWHVQFQFHASGLAVHVDLWCTQHSLEHPTERNMVLGRAVWVDTPQFPFTLSIFQEKYHQAHFSHRYRKAVARHLVGSATPPLRTNC